MRGSIVPAAMAEAVSTNRRLSGMLASSLCAPSISAGADRRLKRKSGVPRKIDPGILRHLGDEGVDQRPAHGLGIDSGEMRRRQQIPYDARGLARIDQIVDD